MNEIRVSVIYHSATGTVSEIAGELADTAEKHGAEVRLRAVEGSSAPPDAEGTPRVREHATIAADPTDVLWADAVLLGSPTRFGNVSFQLKSFLDSLGDAWRKQQLADKIYSVFTATNSPHGGQESTLLALTNSLHHFGGIIVPPGYTDPAKFTDGNPYGTAHCTGEGGKKIDDATRNAARVQSERVVRVSRALKDT
ncbi:flavodoxin family protein [Actinopolyspora saharensis]|uniref:NAD(P)H dehydrogenase (Quinone) n=1 Tax=Actinopolyspora saharensis TaxID=995062 RepID=A0A1H1FBI4_9ACTN|nr:flavodoxin family protein [Actinopolyspora saharensis]SDQ98114.1 NAD(P)H dehydrogenase (quinone) [Actinopolyspora saharensis]